MVVFDKSCSSGLVAPVCLPFEESVLPVGSLMCSVTGVGDVCGPPRLPEISVRAEEAELLRTVVDTTSPGSTSSRLTATA